MIAPYKNVILNHFTARKVILIFVEIEVVHAKNHEPL